MPYVTPPFYYFSLFRIFGSKEGTEKYFAIYGVTAIFGKKPEPDHLLSFPWSLKASGEIWLKSA